MRFKNYIFAFILLMLFLNEGVVQGQVDKFQNEIAPEYVTLMEEARQLKRSGELDQAINKFQSLIQDKPNYYLACYNLALAYVQKKEYKVAIKWFSKAIHIKKEANINEATIYNSLGWTLMLMGDYSKSEKYFLLGKENEDLLSPRSKQKLYNNLGYLYLNKGELDLSEQYFTKSAQEYGSKLAQQNLEKVNEQKEIQTQAVQTDNVFYFSVIGSFHKLEDARQFAEKLKNADHLYSPEIYLAENDYYSVTLGGYLSYKDAVNRVVYAKSKGIAKDAYVWKTNSWGVNLFE